MARKKVETNISYDDARQVYYVCMDHGADENGRRVKCYRTYPTLAQARRGLREFSAERDGLRRVSPRSITLDQWLEYWMEQVIRPNRAQTTVYGYGKIIRNHLSPALGDVPLQKLTPQHLQGYYAMLMEQKGLSANTVRRHHDLLSCALHLAVRQDMLLRSPTDRVEPPRVIPQEARFYTPEELRQLFALVEGHWLEPIVKLAGALGLRREEICGLRWSSVDFARRRVHIKEARTAAGASIVQKETKNRTSNRVLHLGDELCRLLRQERSAQVQRSLARGTAGRRTTLWRWTSWGSLTPPTPYPWPLPVSSAPTACPRSPSTVCATPLPPWPPPRARPCSTLAAPWGTPPPPPPARSTPTFWTRPTPPRWTGWPTP